MKTAFILTLTLATSLAFAKPVKPAKPTKPVVTKACDLALVVGGDDNGVEVGYSQEFKNAVEDKGYRAYEVADVFQAGLTNSNYFIMFKSVCQGLHGSLTRITATTMTMYQEAGASYEVMLRTEPQTKTQIGCNYDLMGFVSKIPQCK